jgi:signal peptide peptidase SppA
MNAIHHEIAATPWAILGEVFEAMKVHDFTVEDVLAEQPDPLGAYNARPTTFQTNTGTGSIAVLPLYGVMTPKAGVMQTIFGGVATQNWTQQLNALIADPMVTAIVLDIDSVGGSVGGVIEAAAAVREGRKKKRIYAVANGIMASAAYWVGSQATQIIVTPSGRAGSIGVFAEHVDISAAAEAAGIKTTLISAGKYKTEGNPYSALNEEAIAEIQRGVDRIYSNFVKDVAAGRGVRASTVERNYGQGRLLDAEDAFEAGLVDRIATFDQVIRTLSTGAADVARVVRADASEMTIEPEASEAIEETETPGLTAEQRAREFEVARSKAKALDLMAKKSSV